MEWTKNFWDSLWENIVSPKVSDEEYQKYLNELRERLPTPVFWLLGKTQSGKTSIIRALTGSSNAEIGNGFKPCTKTAHRYPFPSEEDYFLQFLDTRGLGEVNYDPQEDMEIFQEESHLIMVVIKAMDHAQQSIIEALQKITKHHRDWPILVVQTSLHEGYPAPESEHISPYPYRETPFPANVPDDLARSLMKQRTLFEGMNAHFVPVDFTLLEDGYDPVNYGLDALWEKVEELLPLGLRSMLQRSKETRAPLDEMYFQRAHPHIVSYSVAAGSAGAWPIPYMGTPLVLGVQAKMFHAIASIYGQQLTKQCISEIGSALGIGFLMRLGGRELLKFIPGLGSAMAGVYTGATTYALGRTLCTYFSYRSRGEMPDNAMFRKMMDEQFEVGRAKLKEYLQGAKENSPPSHPTSEEASSTTGKDQS